MSDSLDSLVQHLRVNAFGPCCDEAADRIEALQAIIEENVAQDGKPLLERMDELRTRIVGLEAMLVDGSKREQELEAALREIADYGTMGINERKDYSTDALALATIARRALEAKP